ADPTATGFQVLGAGALPADRFSAAFFFCLGFFASRLDRFCSLFATGLSFTRTFHRNMPRINTESTAQLTRLRLFDGSSAGTCVLPPYGSASLCTRDPS